MQAQAPPSKSGGKTDEELKEEEELQLAIALSQSEAQAKEDAKRRTILQSGRTSNNLSEKVGIIHYKNTYLFSFKNS